MTGHVTTDRVVFDNVSRFYGEVLGVNRVTLSIPPGITSLVGPNGSGKTTVMNLITGLVRPTRGEIQVLGIAPSNPAELFKVVGYATQFDSFPRGLTGFEFIYSYLRLFGMSHKDCERTTAFALGRVNLGEAANRKVAGYSKGMRQRIKLAQAIAHNPRVLVLDEPLNGLDVEMMRKLRLRLEAEREKERAMLISSHVMSFVERISDRVGIMRAGHLVAEGTPAELRATTGLEAAPFEDVFFQLAGSVR